jgi:uncharacterized membrane-anchored protein
MSIGGEKRLGEVEGKHWDRFAGVVRRDPQDVRDRARRLAAAIPEAFAEAIGELPRSAADRDIAAQVVPRLRALAEQTVRGLSGTRRVSGRVVRPYLTELQRSRQGAGR